MAETGLQPTRDEFLAALKRALPEFRQFLDRWYANRSVYRVAAIDDLQQEVLSEAMKSSDTFRIQTGIDTDIKKWLAGITRNVHNHAFKKAKKAAINLEQDAFDNLQHESGTASRNAQGEEQWHLFIDWLARLEPDDNRLVRLLYIEARTRDEVGALLGKDRHFVYRELQRLFRSAREVLFSSGMWKRLEKGGQQR